MKTYRSAIITAILLTGSSPAVAAEEQVLSLLASDILESCHEMVPGQKLRYSFRGSSVLLFDIHFHDGETVHFVKPERLAFKDSGSLAAEDAQSYCLTWSNSQSQPVTLRYRIDPPGN